MPYPFDPTGSSPDNLIVDELQTLTGVNTSTYRILIPENSPFYTNNLVLKYNDGINGDVILNEGIDYVLCLPYLAASRSIGAMLYGGISFNFSALNGIVKITYQTIGGSWIADPDYLYEMLVNKAYNPRVTTWDVLTNVQEIFPPVNHDQSLDYVYGYEELLIKIDGIIAAIANAPSPIYNLGVNLEPDKIVVTDQDGIVTTSNYSLFELLDSLGNTSADDTRLSILEGKVATAETTIISQNGRLFTAETTNTTQDTKLAILEGKVTTAETTNTTQDTRLTTLEGKVTTAETTNTTQDTRLTTNEDTLNNHENRILVLEAYHVDTDPYGDTPNISDLVTRLDTMEKNISDLTNMVYMLLGNH